MTYTPTWTNGDATGRLIADVDSVALDDLLELYTAINRRRRLLDTPAMDPGSPEAISSLGPNLLANAVNDLLDPWVPLWASPFNSPTAVEWLWPVNDGDLNDRIVDTSPASGEVNLFDKLNGGVWWTDFPVAASGLIRAVHFNQLRQAVEWIHRGRWTLPVHSPGGLISSAPDTAWYGGQIANTATAELRMVGQLLFTDPTDPTGGLKDVNVLNSSTLTLTADRDCTVAVYRILRPLDPQDDPPTWNEYDPAGDLAWTQSGGLGSGDTVYIASVALTADTPASLSGTAMENATQAMIDNATPHLLFRRSDSDSYTVGLSASMTVDFELTSPPN